MKEQIATLIDALIDSNKEAAQIRKAMELAYEIGKVDGALEALNRIATTPL